MMNASKGGSNPMNGAGAAAAGSSPGYFPPVPNSPDPYQGPYAGFVNTPIGKRMFSPGGNQPGFEMAADAKNPGFFGTLQQQAQYLHQRRHSDEAGDGTPAEVAKYANSRNEKSPFQSLLEGIAAGVPTPAPPRPGSFPGGPSPAQSGALLSALDQMEQYRRRPPYGTMGLLGPAMR